MAEANTMRHDRLPGSVGEARAMMAYSERILETSASRQRCHRAARMLANLRPLLDSLEREEAERAKREAARVAVQTFDEFDVVWNGIGPIPGSGDAAGLGSTLSGNGFSVGKRV